MITDDNKLYFCFETGVNIFDFESNLSAVIPFAGITKIDVDGTEFTDFRETIFLERSAYRLTIEFSYLSFGLLDNAEMYYILEGQDDHEYLVSKASHFDASYTNLRGGNYTFRLWTQDTEGSIGNIIEVDFYKWHRPLELPIVWVGLIMLAVLIIALIFFGIYKQKMREQKLAMENAALDRINQLKTDLMRTISHEMRTPLAVISGFSEITAENERKLSPESQTAQNLDVIASEAKRMADMMEEMRQLALAKEYSKDRHSVNIDDVINQIAKLYEKVLERKGTKLILDIAENLPSVHANESELTQVLFNLLRNSERHTQEGSITVTVRADNNFIKVAISDTGTGINPELLPQVFERGVHSEDGGTGFGLAICRDIISAYEGKISIESTLGLGTRVEFCLPASRE